MCSGVNSLLSKHSSVDSPEEGSSEPSVVAFVIYRVPRHLCSPLDSRSPLETQQRSNGLPHPKQHILTTWTKPFWLIISTLVDDPRVFVISVGVFITRQRGNWGQPACQLAGTEKACRLHSILGIWYAHYISCIVKIWRLHFYFTERSAESHSRETLCWRHF